MHDSLIKLIDHFPVQSGYVLIFDWFDGECLHSHWSFRLLKNILTQALHFINLSIYQLWNEFNHYIPFFFPYIC